MKAIGRIRMRLNALPLPASNSVLRKAWHIFKWVFWITYFAFIAAVLVLRYSILPNIEKYRPDIERLVSEQLDQDVKIGRIRARWDGINPDLSLFDVQIIDRQNRPAVSLSKVQAVLSWRSVPTLSLKTNFLQIEQPTLNLRRDAQGQFYIAGIPIGQNAPQGGNSSDWIFDQRHIHILGATLIWDDQLRQAPELVLKDFNFRLHNRGRRHRFGLTAQPPETCASMIDIRGNFRVSDIEKMELWSGQAYMQIEQADLAIWQRWIDYPLELPLGKGAVRSWAEFSRGSLQKITTDIAIRQAHMRMAPKLPELNIDSMSGRLKLQLEENGFILDGIGMTLTAYDIGSDGSQTGKELHVEATDFQLGWNRRDDGKKISGQANIDQIDIGILNKLAAYMPLSDEIRGKLTEFSPGGKLSAIKSTWAINEGKLQQYALSGKFTALGLKAHATLPGFSGLTGSVAATQEGGDIILKTKKSSLDLPEVFSDPRIEFDTLEAHAKWENRDGQTAVKLIRAVFENTDAAGQAQGVYRYTGQGTGHIDLIGSLSRGDARAVWRYMPFAVPQDARIWLKDALLSGRSTDTRLTLQGNLDDFPFSDSSKGQFLVTVKAEDVNFNYGEGWPNIMGIYGDLHFEGTRMTIDAKQGSILSTRLSNTRVEIPDLDADIPHLLVRGEVNGATSEFLKFIDQSPVAEKIDHFTEDMRAKGNGRLNLNLDIPLDEAQLHTAKIKGTYHLTNNEITFEPAIPPVRQATGDFTFTADELNITGIKGTLFGGPLTIKGGTQKDASVLIKIDGIMKVTDLQQDISLPALAHLSGETAYQGEITVNQRNADLKISTNLKGLASTLPAPFGKQADDLLFARFEKKLLPKAADAEGKSRVRDQIELALGDNLLSGRVIRVKQDDGFVLERGALSIGGELTLPETGLSLAVNAENINLDAWIELFNAQMDKGSFAEQSTASAPLRQIKVKTPDLVLYGKHYADVDIEAINESGDWKINLTSQQANGNLQWNGAGRGQLSGHLSYLTIDPAVATTNLNSEETIDRLPAIDLVINDFSIGENRFGHVELQAHNERRAWRIDKILATNPYGTLKGNGFWHAGRTRNRTQLDIDLQSSNIGKLLERFAYPNTINGGTASLSGQISWSGTPLAIDYASLTGSLELTARKGQFLKINPGAAGKLLGLVSLQGLPRRVSLDFKDVLSEGLAFDRISAKLDIQNGLMSTDLLEIISPSAKILMHGQVDIKNETQNLDVIIQPEVGGMAAIGVAIGINPLLGVFTWAANKILQDPLNQILAYGYQITGTWADPKVEKILPQQNAADNEQDISGPDAP